MLALCTTTNIVALQTLSGFTWQRSKRQADPEREGERHLCEVHGVCNTEVFTILEAPTGICVAATGRP